VLKRNADRVSLADPVPVPPPPAPDVGSVPVQQQLPLSAITSSRADAGVGKFSKLVRELTEGTAAA
jgi:hypothetical protein